MKRILICFLCLALFAGCGKTQENPTELVITNDVRIMSIKADMDGYQWLYDDDPAFSETTFREAMKLFTEHGSGILYFGYVGCPWCERAVPVLNSAAKDYHVNIYYIDVHNVANTLDDYYAIEPYIQEVFELDANNEPVFKVPEVIAVKNGVIVGHHLALVDGYKIEGADSQMNNEQKQELREIYIGLFEAAAD